jgi:hypothetical protein
MNTYHRLQISRNAKADRNNANSSLKYQKAHCLVSTLLAREQARNIDNDPTICQAAMLLLAEKLGQYSLFH